MIRFKKTNKRQDFIASLLEESAGFPISRIMEEVAKHIEKISKITVNRDLEKLIKLGFIKREGKGRAAFYRLSEHYNLIREIDIEDYFKVETDKRIAKERFNFQIFSFLKNIFTVEEKK